MPHIGAVYNFAVSLTRNAGNAEDLTQDTFLNAFRRFESFSVGTNCKAWLFKICKNLFIDNYRERRRRPQHQEVGTVEPAEHDPSTDVAALEQHQAAHERGRLMSREIENEEIFLDLFGDEINKFLQELPDDFRQALILCDVEGLTYQEIADSMATPIGTVRSRISRARGILRERLEAYAGDLGYLKSEKE